MNDDEDEDMAGEYSDNNEGDDMDEDVQSSEEEFAPVELEDFEKLLQSKEFALKAAQNTRKQLNENSDDDHNEKHNNEEVESIWKPVHQGFGCGIGVLLNGQLPNLDLPAELDELKGGKHIIYHMILVFNSCQSQHHFILLMIESKYIRMD